MEVLKSIEKRTEEKTADYFIKQKVDDLIERSVIEGKKRKQLEAKVSDECSDGSTPEGFDYLTSISDFSAFPKYMGRGFQENAPDISGSVVKTGHATLLLWFADVSDDEIETFKASVVNAGFEKIGDDYVKLDGKQRLSMSISSSAGKLRIFHEITVQK